MSLTTYSVAGVCGQHTNINADTPVFALWNPSSTRRLLVRELTVHFQEFFVGHRYAVQRTTTRGTPGSTVTPDADNSWAADQAPPSGALLDLSVFSANPAVATPGLTACRLATHPGSGVTYLFPSGLLVPPSTGIAIIASQTLSTIPTGECVAVWDEAT